MTTISVDQLLRPEPQTTIINAGDHQGSREIRGAVRYNPHDLLDADHLALPIAHDATVILYAEQGPSPKLHEIAEKMLHDGFADVRVADVRLEDYEDLGGATQDPSIAQAVPPMRPENAELT